MVFTAKARLLNLISPVEHLALGFLGTTQICIYKEYYLNHS